MVDKRELNALFDLAKANGKRLERLEKVVDKLERSVRDHDGVAHHESVASNIVDSSKFQVLMHKVIETVIIHLGKTAPTWLAQPVWLTNIEAATRMGVKPLTLSAMRGRGEGPPWSGSGKWLRYFIVDIDDWILGLSKTSESDSVGDHDGGTTSETD